MGSQLTSPNIKVEDLPIFSPDPWPSEHHDKEGKVLPFQENGRYINPWMKDRPSPAKFFISRKIGPNNLNIPRSKTELDEKLPVHPPPWMPDPGNFRPTRARRGWDTPQSSPRSMVRPSSVTRSSLTEPARSSLPDLSDTDLLRVVSLIYLTSLLWSSATIIMIILT